MSKKKEVDLGDIDDDDMSLIRTLFRKEMSYEEIAKRRRVTVEQVEGVLDVYKVKGQKAVKKNNNLEGTFWYRQHKKWVLNDNDFLTYDAISRKVTKDYPFYVKWLESKYKQDSAVTEETAWRKIDELYTAQAPSFIDESDNNSFEASTGQEGSALIPVDAEELILSSVCNISVGKEFCDGTLFKINNKTGILTSTKLRAKLEDEKSCQGARANFELFEGEFSIPLKSEFYLNEELNIMFLEVDFPDDFKVNPIENMHMEVVAKDKAVCNSVFFSNGEKVLTTCSVTDVVSDRIVLGNSIDAVGAPVFIVANLAGLVTDKNTEVLSIASIKEWLDKELKEDTFQLYDEVKAKWSDGYDYPATMLDKTDNGYKVWFHEYGPGDENKIEVKESEVKLVKPFSTGLSANQKSLVTWLKRIGLEKHKKIFRDNELLDLEELKKLHKEEKLEPKLKEIGIGHGARMKMKKELTDHVKLYLQQSSLDAKIKEILNEPMSDGWEPTKDQLNLNDQFKDSNGNVSISRSLKRIAEVEIIPKDVSKENPTFYLKSTNHNRYFKITVVYEEAK